MKIECNDGFGGKYEVVLFLVDGRKQVKVRSTSKKSSAYESDSDFESKGGFNLGYYESKLLSSFGFSDEQINNLHNTDISDL